MANTKPRKPKHFVPIRPKGRGTIPMKDILAAVERLFKAEAAERSRRLTSEQLRKQHSPDQLRQCTAGES